MKRTIFNTVILACVALFMGSLTLNAVSPRNYIHDTKEENGKIVSKTIFLNEKGLLSKEFKYEFTYNESGQVSEKKAFKWNTNDNEWEPFYLTTYSYDPATGNIHSSYGMWNEKSKAFDLNTQQMTLPEIDYENIFS